MKRILMTAVSILLITGCAPFESILYSPAQTPESWLETQPYAQLAVGAKNILIIQPSTSAIVYLLGLITVCAGVYFLLTRKKQHARLWWGIALLLWGAGALLAGTSYEAFSYYLKCAGRPACIWTSWYEIAYLLLSVGSVDAMLVAVAYSSAVGKLRRGLIGYAVANFLLYTLIVLVGALMPLKFLISFELLILICAPTIAIFLFLNTRRYARLRQRLDLALLGTWGWLILTIGAYFAYYLSGLTQRLWAQRIWFTENDILHIGLILWMLYIVRVLAPAVIDLPVKDASMIEREGDGKCIPSMS